MSAPRYLVDTNVLIRLLVGEPVHQAEATKELFARAAEGRIVLDISALIVAEAFYTLHSFYRLDRREVAAKLLALVRLRGVRLRDEVQTVSALERLQTTNVDFADAYLAAGAAEEEALVVSFDHDLDKFKDITRLDPISIKKASN